MPIGPLARYNIVFTDHVVKRHFERIPDRFPTTEVARKFLEATPWYPDLEAPDGGFILVGPLAGRRVVVAIAIDSDTITVKTVFEQPLGPVPRVRGIVPMTATDALQEMTRRTESPIL